MCQLLLLKKLMPLSNFEKLKTLVGYNIGGTVSDSKSFFSQVEFVRTLGYMDWILDQIFRQDCDVIQMPIHYTEVPDMELCVILTKGFWLLTGVTESSFFGVVGSLDMFLLLIRFMIYLIKNKHVY